MNQSMSMEECINNCNECASICLEGIGHCLGMGGEYASNKIIQTLIACAEVCQTTEKLMRLGVHQHIHVSEACAVICREAAQTCRNMEASDEMMRNCADACERCAETCEELVSGGPVEEEFDDVFLTAV